MTATVTQLYAERVGGGWRVDTAGGDRYTLEHRPTRPPSMRWWGTRVPANGGHADRATAATAVAVIDQWPEQVHATFRRTLRPLGLLR